MKEIYRFKDEIFFHATWQDRSNVQQYKHSLIHPKNTYSPWLGDLDFLEIYNTVKDTHTLVDIYRCYDLWDIAKQMARYDGAVLEVGVWRGGTGAILAKASGNATTVFLCDTFEGVVKATDKDSIYKGGEHSDTSQEVVTNLLRSINVTNYKILKGVFPESTQHLIIENAFKICHIDVDVYQSAKDIFEWVWPKLIPGGMVIFDDYGFAACEGVTQLVNELTDMYPSIRKIYNINGHGILVKVG